MDMKPTLKIDNGILSFKTAYNYTDNIRAIYESKIHFFITYDVYGEFRDECYINIFVIGKYDMTETEIQDFRNWCKLNNFEIRHKVNKIDLTIL